jgi:hypothetical protein
MRRAPLIAILAAGLAGAMSAAAGCSSDGPCPDAPADASTDARGEASMAEAGEDAGGGGIRDAQMPRFSLDATAAMTSLRLANWSTDAPAVDFCLGPHGTNHFGAPIFGSALAAMDGGGGSDAGGSGLAFPTVSAYLPVAPGNYDARLVAAGSTDCSVGIIADLTTLPQLKIGQSVTLGLIGATQPQGLEPTLQMVFFLDDTGIPDAVSMRVINAAVDFPLIDFGVGKTFQPPFLDIPFAGASEGPDASTLDGAAEASAMEASVAEASTAGDASTDGGLVDAALPPTVDPNGYFPETLSGVTLTARPPGTTTPAAVATNVSVAPGAILTIAVLGAAPSADGGADGGAAAQLLECVDNAGTIGLLGDCSIISQ